jgi:methionyl-tRNA synthetase
MSAILASCERRNANIIMPWKTYGCVHLISPLTCFLQRGRLVKGKLDAKGLIYKGSYSGWYSVSDECFYTESQITRTPSVTSPNLAISTETGSTVEWQQEENYMFCLSSFRESLLTHYTKNPRVIFPGQHQADIVQILSEAPLEDLSISRPRTRLSWGIPVPNDPEHTIYVWFDALLVYLAGIGYPWTQGTGLTEGWPANLQVIGKDILR